MPQYMLNPQLQENKDDDVTRATKIGMINAAGGNATDTLLQQAANIRQEQQAREAQDAFFNRQKVEDAYYNQVGRDVLQNQIQQAQQAAQEQAAQQQAQFAPELLPGLSADGGQAIMARPLNEAPQEQRVPLGQMAKQFADQIIKAKALYAMGQQANNPEAMAQAHAGAEYARNALQQLGVDAGAYGLNGTLEEAQQAMAANNLNAVQQVLAGDYAESSGARARNIYNYLVQNGVHKRFAKEIAIERAANYADQRMRALTDAFNMYGLENGTTINQLGMQILQRIGQEEPEVATAMSKGYATPLNEYGKSAQKEMATMQQGFTEKNMATKQKNTLEQMGAQAQLKAKLMQLDTAQKKALQENNHRLAMETEVAKAKLHYIYGGQKAGSKSSSKGNGEDGMKTNEAISVVKLYDEWNKEHDGQESANPFVDAYEEAVATLNNQKSAPHDVNNATSVYHWAQKLLEENYRRNYPMTPDALYQAISAVGGYGPAVAEDLKKDGYLEKYGRTN